MAQPQIPNYELIPRVMLISCTNAQVSCVKFWRKVCTFLYKRARNRAEFSLVQEICTSKYL